MCTRRGPPHKIKSIPIHYTGHKSCHYNINASKQEAKAPYTSITRRTTPLVMSNAIWNILGEIWWWGCRVCMELSRHTNVRHNTNPQRPSRTQLKQHIRQPKPTPNPHQNTTQKPPLNMQRTHQSCCSVQATIALILGPTKSWTYKNPPH